MALKQMKAEIIHSNMTSPKCGLNPQAVSREEVFLLGIHAAWQNRCSQRIRKGRTVWVVWWTWATRSGISPPSPPNPWTMTPVLFGTTHAEWWKAFTKHRNLHAYCFYVLVSRNNKSGLRNSSVVVFKSKKLLLFPPILFWLSMEEKQQDSLEKYSFC